MTSVPHSPENPGLTLPPAVFSPDWYTARLIGVYDPEDVIPHLLPGSGDMVLSLSGPMYRRPFSYRGENSNGSICVAFGDDEEIIVQGTSSASPNVFNVVRDRFPAHAVTRVDVCVDYDFAGAFDALDVPIHFIARNRGKSRPISVTVAGDWDHGEGGRTRYLGAPSSEYRIRVYEKGYQLRSQHPDQTFSLDLVRVEAQIRPRSNAKERAATLSLAELFASTPFGATVLTFLASTDHTAQPPLRPATTDPEYWLARQYGKTLEKWLQYGDAELRAHLLSVLDLRAAAAPRPEPVPV